MVFESMVDKFSLQILRQFSEELSLGEVFDGGIFYFMYETVHARIYR